MNIDSRDQAFAALKSFPRRKAKQDRSALRQQRVTQGAIRAISRYGIAGVTHRRVAQEAHVSPAATTYYYETKTDIIADASHTLLARYVDAFKAFADRHRSSPNKITLRDFALKLVSNALGKHSVETLAWCEIILNGAHTAPLRDLSRCWFRTVVEVWREIAQLLGAQDVEQASSSAIDMVIGLLFVVVPLGLSERQLRSLLSGGTPTSTKGLFESIEHREKREQFGNKAQETRARILTAAVQILIAEGAEALTFRKVSEKANLTVAAPTYYFNSISALLNAAQLQLFEESKVRYRTVMDGADYSILEVAHLIDLTTTVFVREATEFRNLSLACYPVYIQSSRVPSLRPGLWAINAEQWRRWCQVMSTAIPSATAADAWMIYAIFTGKLIRILATGAETHTLTKVRSEFAYDLSTLAAGHHWSTAI
jgi:DNA-binding transcriptional regulator YbjK